jgi:hypothetical protein
MKMTSAEFFCACTCGSDDWKLVRVVPLDAPPQTVIATLPIVAKCSKCSKIAAWISVADVAGRVN